jgi:hypothetical protein
LVVENCKMISLVKDYKQLNLLTWNKVLLNILIIIFKYYNKLVIIILFIVIITFLIFNSLEFFILLILNYKGSSIFIRN